MISTDGAFSGCSSNSPIVAAIREEGTGVNEKCSHIVIRECTGFLEVSFQLVQIRFRAEDLIQKNEDQRWFGGSLEEYDDESIPSSSEDQRWFGGSLEEYDDETIPSSSEDRTVFSVSRFSKLQARRAKFSECAMFPIRWHLILHRPRHKVSVTSFLLIKSIECDFNIEGRKSRVSRIVGGGSHRQRCKVRRKNRMMLEFPQLDAGEVPNFFQLDTPTRNYCGKWTASWHWSSREAWIVVLHL